MPILDSFVTSFLDANRSIAITQIKPSFALYIPLVVFSGFAIFVPPKAGTIKRAPRFKSLNAQWLVCSDDRKIINSAAMQ